MLSSANRARSAAGRFAFSAITGAIAGTTRLGQLAALLPSAYRTALLSNAPGGGRGKLSHWAASEMRNHDVRMLMEAGYALSRYSAEDWIHQIDVPTSILVTTQDRAILPEDQVRLAKRIPGARIHHADVGHAGCALPLFADRLVDACVDVRAQLAT